MELNRDEIIKALECCIVVGDCYTCAYNDILGCHDRACNDALALIRKLTEENKAWQMQLISKEEKADKAYYDLACEVEDLRAENKRLHASYTELARKCASLNDENVRFKADYNELYESTTEEILRLRAELRERPPKLIITKVSKGGS